MLISDTMPMIMANQNLLQFSGKLLPMCWTNNGVLWMFNKMYV